VEDDASVREHTAARLQELGQVVTPCASARDALALLDDGQQFDLLLTDTVMPAMSGIELAAHATARRPGLRVLLTSGSAVEAMHHQDQASAGFQLLQKPYGKVELVQALGAAMADDRCLGEGGPGPLRGQ
jgi:CheY-like chemotaxis protein